MTADELARRCECKPEKIRALVNHPGKVPSGALMKKVCEELQANPCELGWTKTNLTVTPFFMVDVTAFMRMLDIQLQGFVHISELLIAMRRKIDIVYQDYMDRMSTETAGQLDGGVADYLAGGDELDGVIPDDSDSDDW